MEVWHKLHQLNIEGTLSNESAALDEAATDFGGIYRRRPFAVLTPSSENDVAALVRHAAELNIPVAARGAAHSTGGQAQAADGIVINVRELSAMLSEGPDWIWVGGGATWKEVLDHTLARNVMPPVIPDYLGLSVGGTISLGGLGYQTSRYGVIVEHVERLGVVTGAGDVVECSEAEESELFWAVRGGLGQCGIITSARLKLVSAPESIRMERFLYVDLDALLQDLERLSTMSDPPDTLTAFTVLNDETILRFFMKEGARGIWFAPWHVQRLFVLQVGRYSWPDAEPATAAAGFDLRSLPGARHAWTVRFAEFADRADITGWKRAGLWGAQHPWLDIILPGDAAAEWLHETLDELDPKDVADGPVMLYGMPLGRDIRSVCRLPSCDYGVRVDVLRSALPDGARSAQRLIAENRRLYQRCTALGGVHYPSGVLDLSPTEWKAHFSSDWERFRKARERYDPNHILAPGQGICDMA